jgi:poly[(R)-3-hydroxyalkanoate] polymerase subunit PhaC
MARSAALAEFSALTETVHGSWWPDFTSWLAERSGEMKQAPRRLGSPKHRPLGAAPGTYILEQ